ncbi:MAG: hypothetical protein JW881_21835 [Spirochaetales bacterium]|nr:hypothetical protein [Spirochaetales bacterium]
MKVKIKISIHILIKNFLFLIIRAGIPSLLIFMHPGCVSTSSWESSDNSLAVSAPSMDFSDKSLSAIITFKELDLEVPEDPLLKILWQYDPDSYHLVYLQEQIPYTITVYGNEIDTTEGHITSKDGVMIPIMVTDSKFHGWIVSEDHFGQLHDMIPAIHETSHGFTGYYSYTLLSEQNMNPAMYSTYWCFFIDCKKMVVVKPMDIPPVSIIIDVVPLLLKKGRYNVYIEQGFTYKAVFGLLDEFTAYYHNTRFALKLFNYFREKLPQNFKTWNEYWNMAFSWSESYFEFRYFILTYMMVLREVDPHSYESLMENKAFRLAFTNIDDRFNETVNRLEHIFQAAIPDIFNELGYSTEIFVKSYTLTSKLPNGSEITEKLKDLYLKVTIPETSRIEYFHLSQPFAVQLKQEMAQPGYLEMAALLRIDE